MTNFILVLDKYAQADRWVYSAEGATEDAVRTLACYQDPPNSVSKDGYTVVSSARISKRVCGGVVLDDGTIYGLDND